MTQPAPPARLCKAIDPTCPDCQRRTRSACNGDCNGFCDLIAELIATCEGHVKLHAQQRCPKCGIWKFDIDGHSREVQRMCRYYRCVDWLCPVCSADWGHVGPSDCRCHLAVRMRPAVLKTVAGRVLMAVGMVWLVVAVALDVAEWLGD